MKLNKYQIKAKEYSNYNKMPVTGLIESCWVSEEGSEVLRCFRVAYNKQEPLDEDHLQEEMGDVLISLAHLANEMGYSLDDIASASLAKQKKRFDE